ncbi:hypothetical protein PDQ31_18805 [Bacillus cereus]|uniref:hypothetical protein n=1 Tax=Bacillus cereus group sp. MYBK34-1 TaxID=3450631 RepID=UPI003F78E26A|nr:hypothetical protein [Bacillus cereus]
MINKFPVEWMYAAFIKIRFEEGKNYMILPIEKWMVEQDFPIEVTNLLDEGFTCYKAGAYRAGLLFSYLGFEKIIKNRLLDARCPDNVPEGAWTSIQRDVNNDSKWEETVFDTITGYSRNPIFLQDNKKREEMNRHLSYWRDRRNDAAHAKENEINYAHVESFWTFMQSYLPKLVVRGSRTAILDSIEKHFDHKFTPENTDFSHIMQQIKHSLYDEDLISFYQEVQLIFEEIDPFFMIFENKDMNKFWDEIFKLGDPFTTELIRFLKDGNSFNIFNAFISEYTQRIALFDGDKQFIHNLWYDKMKELNNPYKLLAALLRNNLVEEKSKRTAFEKLMLNLKNKTPSDDLDYKTLIENGYLTVFKERVFTMDDGISVSGVDFKWANSNINPICHYISNNVLDEQVVRWLCVAFYSPPYPDKLRASLNELFSREKELKQKFIKIAQKIGVTPPVNLGFNEQ